jgi:hypothetical protein
MSVWLIVLLVAGALVLAWLVLFSSGPRGRRSYSEDEVPPADRETDFEGPTSSP